MAAKGVWAEWVRIGGLIIPVTHTELLWWRGPRNFSIVSLGSLLCLVLLGISSLFPFQSVEGLNLLRETRRKAGPITWYVVYTWCHSQPSGLPRVPRVCWQHSKAGITKALPRAGTPHPCHCHQGWPATPAGHRGTFEKERMLSNIS